MKTTKSKIAAALIAASCFLGAGTLNAQCCTSYDFSSASGWTSVGSGVAVSGGSITFSGASDGFQPSFVYTTLPAALSNTMWSCDFEFKPSGGTGPYHSIVSFTESGSPVINAHGMRTYSGGTVTYSNTNCIEVRLSAPAYSTNPGAWELIGASKLRSGTYGYNLTSSPTWCESAGIPLPSNAFSISLYGRLSRLSSTLGMISVYSDAGRNTLLGCQTFCIDPAVGNLTIMQAGNIPGGALSRNFYGRVDNVNLCDFNPTITGDVAVCSTDPASNYLLNNGNSCTYANCGFPGATSYTWSVPAGSTMSPGSYGTCFNIASGNGNSCMIDVNSDGYVSCTVNYPCTSVIYKVYVDVSNPPVSQIATTSSPYCEGEAIILNGAPSANETSYQWEAAQCDVNGNVTGTWNIGPTLTGTAGLFNLATIVSPSLLNCHRYYKVQLRTFNGGCHYALTSTVIEIVCPPNLTVSASPTFLCPGGTTTLTASGAATYSWSPTATLTCPTCASTQASPAASQTYTVTGTNPNCPSATAAVTINVSTLTANAGADHSMCCNDFYNMPLTISGGTAPYTIVWSPTTNLTCSHSGAHTAASCPNPNVRTCVSTTYTVTVTDAAGCVVTDQVQILINCRMGKDEAANSIEPGNKLSIYPNPATQQATITTGDVLAESIIITDVSGREVYRVKPSATSTLIDLGAFPAGIYMVQVIGNNETQTLQLVIEK